MQRPSNFLLEEVLWKISNMVAMRLMCVAKSYLLMYFINRHTINQLALRLHFSFVYSNRYIINRVIQGQVRSALPVQRRSDKESEKCFRKFTDARYQICTTQGCRIDQTRRQGMSYILWHRDAFYIYVAGSLRGTYLTHGDFVIPRVVML